MDGHHPHATQITTAGEDSSRTNATALPWTICLRGRGRVNAVESADTDNTGETASHLIMPFPSQTRSNSRRGDVLLAEGSQGRIEMQEPPALDAPQRRTSKSQHTPDDTTTATRSTSTSTKRTQTS